MPRKGPAQRREMTPDPVYRSLLVTQLVNKITILMLPADFSAGQAFSLQAGTPERFEHGMGGGNYHNRDGGQQVF